MANTRPNWNGWPVSVYYSNTGDCAESFGGLEFDLKLQQKETKE